MTSADGFTRYDLVADRDHGKSVAEKHRQRLVNERRAVRSAVRSQILEAEGKSHPTVFVGKTPSQLHHELAESAAAADSVAVKTVDKLLGETSAAGGGDPRVRHHKIKSAAKIDKEIKAASEMIDKAREQLIERGDPLKYVQIPAVPKLKADPTREDLAEYRAAVDNAASVARIKRISEKQYKARTNQIEKGLRAVKNGEVGISKLLLEANNPELLGITPASDYEAVRNHVKAVSKAEQRISEKEAGHILRAEREQAESNARNALIPEWAHKGVEDAFRGTPKWAREYATQELKAITEMTPMTRKTKAAEAEDVISQMLSTKVTPIDLSAPIDLMTLADLNLKESLAADDALQKQSHLLLDEILAKEKAHKKSSHLREQRGTVEENRRFIAVHIKSLTKKRGQAADFQDNGAGYPARKPTHKARASKRK